MIMLGKVDQLAGLVHPQSRLRRGLQVLQDCLAGRRPEVTSDVARLAPGAKARVDLEGDALCLLIQCYKPKRREEGRFEAHERHTDLQFIWSGREIIELCDLQTALPAVTYDPQGNVYFPLGNEPQQQFLVQAGEVAILMPGEAHAPCLRPEGEHEELVRKIVVKVRDAHLLEKPERALSGATGQGPGLAGTAQDYAPPAFNQQPGGGQ